MHFTLHVLLHMGAYLHLVISQDGATVYQITSNSASGKNSYIYADLPQPIAEDGITVCTWFRINYFLKPSVILSISTNNQKSWILSIALTPKEYLIQMNGNLEVAPFETFHLFWYHFCALVTPEDLTIFVDAKKVHETKVTKPELFKESLRVFAGGGEPWPDILPLSVLPINVEFSQATKMSERKSFDGDLFTPSIWGTILLTNDLSNLGICGKINTGQLQISWTPSDNLIKSKTLPGNEPCTMPGPRYIFFPSSLTFEENKQACSKLQLGIINYPKGEEVSAIITKLGSLKNKCGGDEPVLWIEDNQIMESSKCSTLTTTGRNAISCESKICSGCFLIERTRFTLRGLCSAKSQELSFILTESNSELHYSFRGIEMFDIMWKNERWELTDRLKNEAVAITDYLDSPVGLNSWLIKSSFCQKENGSKIMASLNACGTYAFPCRNGQCIHSSRRCDHIPDCLDESDEEMCSTVRLPAMYKKTLPPPPNPSRVEVDIDIFRVLSTPPEKVLSLRMEVNFSWNDSRVLVANLQPGIETSLPLDSGLWVPRLLPLSIDNSLSIQPTNGNHEGTFSSRQKRDGSCLSAVTYGDPLPDFQDTPLKDVLFSGANTTFTLQEFVDQDVDCQFDFSFFPFDEHVCSISLILVPWPRSILRFHSRLLNARYLGPSRLLHYTLKSTTFQEITKQIGPDRHSGIAINLYIVRRPALYILSIYLPSFILVLLGNATLWIKCTYSQTPCIRIYLNCFVLLTYLLLWVLSATMAPSNGHLTAIDVWLCFCTTHSLLLVSVYVLLDIFTGEREDDGCSKIGSRMNSSRIREIKPLDNVSLYNAFLAKLATEDSSGNWAPQYWILLIARVVSPGLIIFFNLGYWPFVLYFTKHSLP